jgi:hypothetical protein
MHVAEVTDTPDFENHPRNGGWRDLKILGITDMVRVLEAWEATQA